MNKEVHTIPAVAIRSIATGILMMAFFTSLWAGIAYGGLKGSPFRFALIIFPIFIIVFVINAIKLFRVSKHYAELKTEADIAEGKRMGKWFGIIFGAEGLCIFIGINIVTNIGHPDLIIPVIALVVGLHFYPMAKIFKRTLDYYIATWSTTVAICGIVFTLYSTMLHNTILAFVGIGLAISTSAYATYMIFNGRRLTKNDSSN